VSGLTDREREPLIVLDWDIKQIDAVKMCAVPRPDSLRWRPAALLDLGNEAQLEGTHVEETTVLVETSEAFDVLALPSKMELDRLAVAARRYPESDYSGRQAVQTDGTISITQGSEAAMAINDRTTAKPGHKRYEELAEEIARQIAANVLRPGDRLPSIRQTCRTRHLSPSTVFQAYDLLENRGLIRAAPRSGYFVNPPASAQAPEPAMSTPPEGAHPVEITDLVYEILSSVKSRKIVPLGSAFPGPLLFPLDSLRKAQSSSTRYAHCSKFSERSYHRRRIVGEQALS
jgi:DNA-binding transcriptional regulator YhcF (GntR family)